MNSVQPVLSGIILLFDLVTNIIPIFELIWVLNRLKPEQELLLEQDGKDMLHTSTLLVITLSEFLLVLSLAMLSVWKSK